VGAWLLRRLLHSALTLVLAGILFFVLMRLAPGDPLATLTDERPVPPAEIARLRARYGVDQPIAAQLRAFASGLARGDLGTSIQYGRPVTQLILERLPASLLLGATVLLIDFTLGLWIGVRQALRAGGAFDHAAGVASLVGYSLPSFWLGLGLAGLFGIRWHLLPVAGMTDPLRSSTGALATALDILRHLVLPAATLVLVSIAAAMRYQRAAMLDALGRPFVQAARARGLAEGAVVWRHAWRNALFPVVTLFGLWLPILATGAVFVEFVFGWPGLGALAANAAEARDYPVLMGSVLLTAVLVLAGGIVADLAYAALDPRVRHR
jgi:peptide/nickel transport system permease protein